MINTDTKIRMVEIINEAFVNPYPKDIFRWNNKEKIDLTRGRFNEFINSIVENARKDIIKIIEDSD